MYVRVISLMYERYIERLNQMIKAHFPRRLPNTTVAFASSVTSDVGTLPPCHGRALVHVRNPNDVITHNLLNDKQVNKEVGRRVETDCAVQVDDLAVNDIKIAGWIDKLDELTNRLSRPPRGQYKLIHRPPCSIAVRSIGDDQLLHGFERQAFDSVFTATVSIAFDINFESIKMYDQPEWRWWDCIIWSARCRRSVAQ